MRWGQVRLDSCSEKFGDILQKYPRWSPVMELWSVILLKETLRVFQDFR